MANRVPGFQDVRGITWDVECEVTWAKVDGEWVSERTQGPRYCERYLVQCAFGEACKFFHGSGRRGPPQVRKRESGRSRYGRK